VEGVGGRGGGGGQGRPEVKKQVPAGQSRSVVVLAPVMKRLVEHSDVEASGKKGTESACGV